MALGLGIVVYWATQSGPAAAIVSAFKSRVIADGGTVESPSCAKSDIAYLTSNPSTPDLLLNDYGGAAAAYSLRLLDKSYTGDAIVVRRSSDNTTQNIGFVNNELDTATLESFCSGTDGFVTTWYDQSGNANDVVNATASQQPKIVNSGSTILENGKAAIQWDGVDDELNFSGDISATEVSSIIVAKAITHGVNNRFFGWKNSSFSFLSTLIQGANSTLLRGMSQTSDTTQGLLYNGVDYTNNSLISMYNALIWRINGNEFSGAVSTGSTGVRNTNGLALGSRGDGGNDGNVQFQEAIFYPNDQSTNRTGIETNINSYYSIY